MGSAGEWMWMVVQKVSMACLRNCTFLSFYICKRQLEEVTKQIFIPDAPLTTLSDSTPRQRISGSDGISKQLQFFYFIFI
jgi:hypothetical protein